jgi:leucyl aminopeptidase
MKKAINLIKKLGRLPPNILSPEALAMYFDTATNNKQYVGINAVGGGDGWLGYTPLGTDDSFAKIAVVGKGITFDSGGISAKPCSGMWKMKCDMLGAATALALSHTLDKNLRVDLYGCIAENTPRTNGMRPSDVLTYPNGTKVEVVDTDAEGRLVLADGILEAKENGAELIITIATLTGAALAVDPATVLFSNNERAAKAIEKSAIETNEKLVRFPIYDEHRKAIKGAKGVADIKNLGEGNKAGACTAAAFLEHFVGDTMWIHLDIAGSATDKNGEPTGAMLATLTHFINNWSR